MLETETKAWRQHLRPRPGPTDTGLGTEKVPESTKAPEPTEPAGAAMADLPIVPNYCHSWPDVARKLKVECIWEKEETAVRWVTCSALALDEQGNSNLKS